MAAPTGLHGWIQSNDGRSTGLFIGFLLAIQVIAPLVLVLPLMLVDPDHAPFGDWGRYLLRYAPLVLVASVAWFVAQLWWHVETVKRAVGFRFVDGDDEPRLCAVVEPLIIMAGLPTPFIGVIESDARNAFACGIGRKKAVIVVTRGLLDALSDAELGAVLAHELSHIKHGDIRLMAAANIFMGALTRLQNRNVLRFTWIHGVSALAVPAILPLSIVGSLVGRWGLQAGRVSRLLIASSREFIADAQAAQWTKDPGALATALLKVDGRHRIAQARAEDDAMMIAGESDGPGATHPTVAQRVAALARVTGSMVWNAPNAPRDGDWTAGTGRAEVERLASGRRALAAQALARVRRGDGNLLGLTCATPLGLVLTIGALIGLHWDRLGDGRAMAATLDPRPLGLLVRTAGACQLSPFSPTARARCEAGTRDGSLHQFEGMEGTPIGLLAEIGKVRRERGLHGGGTLIDSLGGDPNRQLRLTYTGQSGKASVPAVLMTQDGRFVTSGGVVAERPEALVIAETERVGCFVAEPRGAEQGDPTPLDSLEVQGRTMADVRRQAAEISLVARAGVPDVPTVRRYLEARQDLVDVTYALYRDPGLAAVRTLFATNEHKTALAVMREAADRPEVMAVLTPVEQAKLRALLRDPDAFVPCRSLAS